jgi:ABC-type nickel/cobalt efflux system permease component RcnA
MRLESRVFDVQPLARHRWRVSSEGSTSEAMFVSERDAVQYAHACAQAFRPSSVRVFASDGSVRDAWSYGAFKGIRPVSAASPSASSSPEA